MSIQPKKIEIKWLENTNSGSYFNTGSIEFCLVSEKNEQIFAFVGCKDYLQDIVLSFIRNKPGTVASNYNIATSPKIDLKKLRLLVLDTGNKFMKDQLPNSLDIIHQIEKHLKIRKTKIFEISNPKPTYKNKVWYYSASRRWISSPVMLSFYTLIVRISFSHEKGIPFKETLEKIIEKKIYPRLLIDQQRVHDGKKGIDRILKFGDKEIFYQNMKRNYPDVGLGTSHNNLGICGYSSSPTSIKTMLPRWFKNFDKAEADVPTKENQE